MMTREQLLATLRMVGEAIVETCREAGPEGAPRSSVFMALQSELGCTLGQFNVLIDALVQAGRLRATPTLLFAKDKP